MVESFVDKPYAARRFQDIVDHARQNNPFYRRWIQDPTDVPILDRTTYLDHNEEILNGHEVTAATSGSTGVPVRFSISPERAKLARDDRNLFLSWIGGPVRTVNIVHAYGDSPDPNLLSVNVPIREQIEFIQARRRTANIAGVITYPTNGDMLARTILESGADMSFISRVGPMSEAVDTELHRLIAEAFPAALVWISYSSREFGLIGITCPHRPDYYHLMAHHFGIEVLRDDGERGRVVVTDFFNTRSPFIRYELGDHAVRGKCPCGRIRLPSLRHVYGKIRGALLHRNGNRITFCELSIAMRSMPGLRQFQVIQHSTEEFTLRLVGPEALHPLIDQAFREHFGYLPANIEYEHVDWIDRENNGKLHESICLC